MLMPSEFCEEIITLNKALLIKSSNIKCFLSVKYVNMTSHPLHSLYAAMRRTSIC